MAPNSGISACSIVDAKFLIVLDFDFTFQWVASAWRRISATVVLFFCDSLDGGPDHRLRELGQVCPWRGFAPDPASKVHACQ